MDEKMVAKLQEIAKEAAASAVSELKPAEKEVEKKDVVETKEVVKDFEGMSKKEKIGEFIKAVYHKDFETMEKISGKAVNTGTDSAGGYLVWEEWARMIDKAARESGVTRKLANVIPMSAATLHIAKGDASVSVAWVGEGNDFTESNPTFSETQLTAKKLGAISVATREVIEDSVADVVDYITTDIGESIALEEDNQMLNGSGSSPAITGVLQSSDVNITTMGTGDTSFADVSADDLYDVIASIEHQRRSNATWVMSDYVFNLVKKLKDSQNRPLYQALTEAERGFLLGYPVEISNQAPGSSDDAAETAFIAFGDFKRGVVMGLKKGLTIDISDSAYIGTSSMFQEDKVAIRVLERVDISIHLPSYLAILKTAASGASA